MKTPGTTSISCLLALAAWFGTNPVSAQPFLRAPVATATDLVGTRIVIEPEDLSTTAVARHFRTFKVNPNAFFFAVEELIGIGLPVEENKMQERVRNYFRAAGIDLTGNDAPRFYFNHRTGILTVQGAIAQLEAVEKSIKALTAEPARVSIEVRLLETTSKLANTRVKALLSQLEADDFVLPSALPLEIAENSTRLRNAVLTYKEFANLLRSVEQSEGIDLLSAPPTVTVSGRQARIVIEEPYETITDPPIHGGGRLKLNAE
jgi:type II secretory pathway component GspD/PulD (secretin)